MMMFDVKLETLCAEINASQFGQFLRAHHFQLRHARYDFSPRDYEVDMLILRSEPYRCSLMFVYPRGTVDIYIGPLSADFHSDEWIRIDYLSSFLAQASIIAWYGSKSFEPKSIIRDVLSKLYEVFAPVADQALGLFVREDYRKQIADARQYALERLPQK